jgi:hypothetical protein
LATEAETKVQFKVSLQKIIKGSVHGRLSSSSNSKENIKKWIGMMQTRRITIYLMNFVVKCDLWSTLELLQGYAPSHMSLPVKVLSSPQRLSCKADKKLATKARFTTPSIPVILTPSSLRSFSVNEEVSPWLR